ncbi:hypothetical protein [Actinomadura rayongensis]|uniref:Uncharacterized protein n=1 Tax=Actinomadura rayongensis TaxID=1429076 RepID=A0A6I4WBQ9_9ACTN|nr:hypothetical protein [Actinomadura rayongensis]MXQ66250.1 hypothetical protein [Actinomadura rayongensis]
MGAIGIGGSASPLLGRILLPDVEFQVLFLFGAVSLLLVPASWWIVPAMGGHCVGDGAETPGGFRPVKPGEAERREGLGQMRLREPDPLGAGWVNWGHRGRWKLHRRTDQGVSTRTARD